MDADRDQLIRAIAAYRGVERNELDKLAYETLESLYRQTEWDVADQRIGYRTAAGELNQWLAEKDCVNELGSRDPVEVVLPPRNAVFLLRLIRAPQKESLEGDLIEDFKQIATDPRQGLGRAKFWYWWQVLRLCRGTFQLATIVLFVAKYWHFVLEFLNKLKFW